MFLLVAQYFLGRTVPSLPAIIGRRGLPRGKLQDFLDRVPARTSSGWRAPSIRATTGG